MKLSGWQRIGIVASALWVIGGGIYGFNTHSERFNRSFDSNRRFCLPVPKFDEDAKVIAPTIDEEMRCVIRALADTEPDNRIARFFIYAFAPLPFVWLLGWVVIGTVRWVIKGFRRPSA